MTIDNVTLTKLQHQGRRMHYALANGNQREADVIQRRVDQILDERPRVFAVAPDGETVFDNASPWVKAQVVGTGVPGCPTVRTFGLPEELEPDVLREAQRIIDEDGGAGTGGGVGLLDRP